MKYEKSYLIGIQFLGFRFHGWQKQKNVKTLHEMLDKTLTFVFGHEDFKTIGVGRTDSKVSANNYYLQLFINESVKETSFIKTFNSNAPGDIKGLSVSIVSTSFNILQAPKIKEYLYFFSYGQKNNPFATPFIVGVEDKLDIELMKLGAKLFEGEHYFHKYCTKPSQKTIF